MRTISRHSILLVALCLAQVAHGQTNRRRTPAPAPPVTAGSLTVSVVLKDGQTLKAKFVNANSKKLSIIVGSSQQELDMSDIASLIFSETKTSTGARADSASMSAARDAIKDLRKLHTAASVGVSRNEYYARLIDGKAAIDELLRQISEGDLKSEIDAAMREYVSAGDIWEILYNRNIDEIRKDRGSAGILKSKNVPQWIVEKYNLKPDDAGGTTDTSYGTVHHPPRYLTSSILGAVWRRAQIHLEKAAQLAQ